MYLSEGITCIRVWNIFFTVEMVLKSFQIFPARSAFEIALTIMKVWFKWVISILYLRIIAMYEIIIVPKSNQNIDLYSDTFWSANTLRTNSTVKIPTKTSFTNSIFRIKLNLCLILPPHSACAMYTSILLDLQLCNSWKIFLCSCYSLLCRNISPVDCYEDVSEIRIIELFFLVSCCKSKL